MDPVQARKHNNSEVTVDPNDKSKRKGPKGIINRFFHYTTINGLQRLASSKTILGRLFWILILLGATGMFSKDIYDLVQQFFDRPVNVVSKVEYFRVRSDIYIISDTIVFRVYRYFYLSTCSFNQKEIQKVMRVSTIQLGSNLSSLLHYIIVKLIHICLNS